MPRSKEPLRFPMARGHSPATPSRPIAPGAAGCPRPPAPAPRPPVPGTPQSQLRQATSSKLALFQPGQFHQETIWKGGSSKLFSTLTTRQNTGWGAAEDVTVVVRPQQNKELTAHVPSQTRERGAGPTPNRRSRGGRGLAQETPRGKAPAEVQATAPGPGTLPRRVPMYWGAQGVPFTARSGPAAATSSWAGPSQLLWARPCLLTGVLSPQTRSHRGGDGTVTVAALAATWVCVRTGTGGHKGRQRATIGSCRSHRGMCNCPLLPGTRPPAQTPHQHPLQRPRAPIT